MNKRPLCMVCVLFMAALALLDGLGLPIVRGNPLPKALQEEIEKNPKAEVYGEAEGVRETEYGGSLVLKNAFLMRDGKELPLRNLKVYLNEYTGIAAGSYVLLSGRLERIPAPTNPGEFDSRQYYACDHIYYALKKADLLKQSHSYSNFKQTLAAARSHFSAIFHACTGDSAPIFDAIVLGDKSGLDEEIKLRFQLSGIIHILAISGLHISILGIGLYSLLKRLGAGIACAGLISLPIMLVYGMMTGSGISTLRAVGMFVIAVGARLLGRIYDLPTALAVMAILILVESPAYLYSASFLLSFGAVAGIVTVGQPFSRALKVRQHSRRRKAACIRRKTVKQRLRGKLEALCAEGEKENSRLRAFSEKLQKVFLSDDKRRKEETSLPDSLLTALLASLAIQLAMLPILLFFYGEVSLSGIFLNLLVLPTAGIVLGCAVFTLLAGEGLFLLSGMAAVKNAGLFAVPGRLLLRLYNDLSSLTARLPYCTFVGGRPAPWQIGLYYAILLASLRILKTWTKHQEEALQEEGDRSKTSPLVRFCPILSTLLILSGIFALTFHAGSSLRILCLDVGQGDGILLIAPRGNAYLIDGGSSSKQQVGRYQILPAIKSQGISHLNGILVSHTDLDHISGVMELLTLRAAGLSSVSVGTLYLPDWGEHPPEEWEELKQLALKCGTKVQKVKAGDMLRTPDLVLTALAPLPGSAGTDVNEEGMVLLAESGKFKGLFTGDIGEETEKKLIGCLPDVDFLKVGHHGSKGSSCEEFLAAIRPEFGVISCAAKNRYGHPSPEAVRRLTDAGCRLAYTMESGAVELNCLYPTLLNSG